MDVIIEVHCSFINVHCIFIVYLNSSYVTLFGFSNFNNFFNKVSYLTKIVFSFFEVSHVIFFFAFFSGIRDLVLLYFKFFM